MFEVAEIGESLTKKEYRLQIAAMREALIRTQDRLKNASFSVVIVIAGVEGSGKGDAVNRLVNFLDAREVETHALSTLPESHESQRPHLFRFWSRLPRRGKTAIFFGSWYTEPIVRCINGELSCQDYNEFIRQIVEFERMLTNEDVLIIKFWLHITKKRQRKRFKQLESNPETSWRVSERDWDMHRTYDQFVSLATNVIRQTSTAHAAWRIVESGDAHYRDVTIMKNLVTSIDQRLAEPDPVVRTEAEPPTPPKRNVINQLDLSQRICKKEYSEKLAKLQARIGRSAREMSRADASAILVFEGSDAAGKGGCIHRITQALDARFCRVVQVARPSDEELARPYLWRFWRTLPGFGKIGIYDRSWYGRVLVERVEKLCSTDDWRRAYSEINDFEEQLRGTNALILKFWLSISEEEQLRRFRRRENLAYKRYKITPEDWRNRAKWLAYEASACEMIERTSTESAPWHLIEANDKRFARIKVLTTLERTLTQWIE